MVVATVACVVAVDDNNIIKSESTSEIGNRNIHRSGGGMCGLSGCGHVMATIIATTSSVRPTIVAIGMPLLIVCCPVSLKVSCKPTPHQ